MEERLQAFAQGTGAEDFDPDVVGRDDRCDFGRWLHGDGAVVQYQPSNAAVVSAHATFHRNAADIVRRIKAGKTEEAQRLLAAPESQYGQASRAVILSMSRLKREVQG